MIGACDGEPEGRDPGDQKQCGGAPTPIHAFWPMQGG